MKQECKKVLIEVAAKIDVTAFLDSRAYLQKVYSETKARLENYSYLQFSEDLGFSYTNALRLSLAGRRPLTPKAAIRIADGLELHGVRRRYFTSLVRYNYATDPKERESAFGLMLGYRAQQLPVQLDQQQMDFFSEWYHTVIREMVGLPDFDGDPEWIRERLCFPLRLEYIKESLELLKSLGYVAFDAATGKYVRAQQDIVTAREVEGVAIVRYAQAMIDIGKDAINRVPEGRREVRSLTVCIPESAMAEIKNRVQAMLLDILALEKRPVPGETVVQVNVQIFPFTRPRKGVR